MFKTYDQHVLDSEEWVPAAQAFRETIALYASCRDGDASRAEEDAINAFFHRLVNEQMWARSHYWQHKVLHEIITDDDELVEEFAPSHSSDAESQLIVSEFWWNLMDEERQRKEVEDDLGAPLPVRDRWVDWVAGDFQFLTHTIVDGGPVKSITLEGFACSVHFNRRGLPGSSRLIGAQPSEPQSEREMAPPISQAALDAWWGSLSAKEKQRGQTELWHICRAQNPRHSVTRERIRELTGPRKRGPRPFSGKPFA